MRLQVDAFRYFLVSSDPLATGDAVGLAYALHRHHSSNDFFVVEDGRDQEVASIRDRLRTEKSIVHEGLHFDCSGTRVDNLSVDQAFTASDLLLSAKRWFRQIEFDWIFVRCLPW